MRQTTLLPPPRSLVNTTLFRYLGDVCVVIGVVFVRAVAIIPVLLVVAVVLVENHVIVVSVRLLVLQLRLRIDQADSTKCSF